MANQTLFSPSIPHSTPPSVQYPRPTTPKTTTTLHSLTTFDPIAPILRFSFPTAASQASFHHAFALIRTNADKASFLSRFTDNFDAQVIIRQSPARWDTSNDEALARELWDSAAAPPTEGDENLARVLWEDAIPDTSDDILRAQRLAEDAMSPPTHGDAEVAALSQRETPLPDVSRDEDIARMLQEGAN